MAILTPAQLDAVRQGFVREFGTATATRPQLNAAIQAVEDIFTGTTLQNAINNAINNATGANTLNATQKQLLVRWVLFSRYVRGNV
jgi:hypothetical protein